MRCACTLFLLAFILLPLSRAQAQGLPGSQTLDLGQGVPALQLRTLTPAGVRQSLLLADVGLLGLVYPADRQAYDELAATAAPDRALLVVITSDAPSSWRGELVFTQAGLRHEISQPFRLRVLVGDAESVAPESPVMAVALVPEAFNLRRPLTVEWGEAFGTVTFRR